MDAQRNPGSLNWLEAQLAMIQAGVVRLEQVLLPFAQDSSGKTLYERMREAKFSGLLLEQSESAQDATTR